MADDQSREEQNASAPGYEPPTVTRIGSVDELTAQQDAGSIDSPDDS